MKVLFNTLGERRQITKDIDYTFEKRPDGYALIRYGYNMPFVSGIEDYAVFENKNVIYVSFFTERHEYALYEYFNELECFKKVFSMEMKKCKPFSVEIDLGLSEAEKDYMSLLPNLKFEREGKAAGEVIKIPEVYEDDTFLIKICSRRFISLTIFDENREGDKRIKYVLE